MSLLLCDCMLLCCL